MKHFKNLLLFCIGLTVASFLKASPLYCTGDTLHCIALNGLKLRETPKGKVISTVLLGDNLIVVARDPTLDTYEGIAGAWVKVRFKSQVGYVFDGYLSKMPAPSLSDTSFSAYLNRTFLKIGKPARFEHPCPGDDQGESTFIANIQLYQHGNFLAKHIDYLGWEWGHEAFTLDYVTLGEIYLICKIVYQKSIDSKPFAMPQEDRGDGEGPSIRISFVDTQEGGSDYLAITYSEKPDKQVLITREFGY